MVGEISMTGYEERIFSLSDLGVDVEYEECVIRTCGRPATRWIPSHIDGKLMPACDKHYYDSRIIPRRWENARKKREDAIRELIGKKCYYCGKQAIGWEDENVLPALEKYGNDLPSDYVPKYKWLCADCFLSDT